MCLATHLGSPRFLIPIAIGESLDFGSTLVFIDSSGPRHARVVLSFGNWDVSYRVKAGDAHLNHYL